jgi:hypothetical protein
MSEGESIIFYFFPPIPASTNSHESTFYLEQTNLSFYIFLFSPKCESALQKLKLFTGGWNGKMAIDVEEGQQREWFPSSRRAEKKVEGERASRKGEGGGGEGLCTYVLLFFGDVKGRRG